ncbi:hypothetical protein PsorP6_009166 [Peronosclerospora sorghi]|uniref:Uncharacterized protein n=1 Tax=Peronosclerospora sorghi TaxID=230839 RepID=A0ACC0VZ27_9STRA|nr:hypothetical protein PsorP6_009166 [Peronosclerospora sorghi]
MNLEVVKRDDLSSAQMLEKTIEMEREPELIDMLKELLIIVRKCGHITIVSYYMSSVESFPIDRVVISSVTVNAGRMAAQNCYPQILPSILIICRQQPGHFCAFKWKSREYCKIRVKSGAFC